MEVKTKTLKVNLYNIPLKHSSSCDKRKTKMSTNVLKVLRMKKTTILHILLLLFIFIFILPKISSAADTITPSLSIQDGETIVSSTQHFELGFFSNDDTKSTYLGIWYKKIQPQTIVWVANRNNPITDSTGVLKIGDNGNLELVDQASRVVWSSNVTQVFNPVAQLLDNGNLVIREEGNIDPKDYLWQSFDHPTDTLLPEMKLGWNLKSGLERTLTSWKTASDPSTGDYTFRIDRHGLPQTFILNKFVPRARSGSWNGKIFTGLPLIKQSQIFNFNYRSNEDDLFYSFSLKNESVYSRLVMSQSGQLQRYTWLENAQAWKLFWSFPTDQCDDYNECGANAICSVKDLSVCSCLSGFEPKNPVDWDMRDGSGGCMQKTRSDCQKSNGFLQLKKMKLPDTSLSFVDSSMNLKECEAECRRNFSCKAYANLDITNGGSGCIMWFDELLDLREYDVEGQDLYIRVAISPLGDARRKYNKDDSKRKKTVVLVATLTLILTLFLLIFGFCLALRKKIVKIMKNRTANKRVHQETSQELPLVNLGKSPTRESASSEPIDELELRLFDLCTMATATDNFSVVNKLGQGGFGCVYKGILEDGQQIAVKRLSKSSSQGVEEFKNEIILIAKLQHRNLVRLLGHCFEGEEKLLVYEYMENKSLDSFLFDTSDNFTLDWQTRFNIIVGIARGLLYLHQDSRFRIIHRDLKPTNVLLDADMNPKISDFGMARIFGGDQTEANTRRVVGTYGYMSPEYAMDGRFSIKSDIFSLGVLMLEIISGIKNGGFYSSNSHVNLLGHAWKLWIEGNGLNLVDTSIGDSYPASEVLRCVQIALLCVQERADDRPNMASVVLMLISENPTMPQPKKAGFCFVEATAPAPANEDRSDNSNQITITMLEAR